MKKKIYVLNVGILLISILFGANSFAQKDIEEYYTEVESKLYSKSDSVLMKMSIVYFGNKTNTCMRYVGMGMDSIYTVMDRNVDSMIVYNLSTKEYYKSPCPESFRMKMMINDMFSSCEVLGDSMEINGYMCHNMKLKTMVSHTSGEESIMWIAKDLNLTPTSFKAKNRCIQGYTMQVKMVTDDGDMVSKTKELRLKLTDQEKEFLLFKPLPGYKLKEMP